MTELTKKDLRKLAKSGLEGAAAGKALRIAMIKASNSSKSLAKLADSFEAAEASVRKFINGVDKHRKAITCPDDK